MNRIPIDSPNLGRTKPTPNLNTLGLRTQQTNKFLRNTCTNNSDFLLANRLGAGSYGFKRSPTALEKYINAFEERQRVKIPSSKKKSPQRVPSPKKKSPSPPRPIKDDEERQRLNRYLLTLNPPLPASLGPSKKKSKSKIKSPPGFFKNFKGLFDQYTIL